MGSDCDPGHIGSETTATPSGDAGSVQCVSNHDPNSRDPVFRMFLRKTDRWYIDLPQVPAKAALPAPSVPTPS